MGVLGPIRAGSIPNHRQVDEAHREQDGASYQEQGKVHAFAPSCIQGLSTWNLVGNLWKGRISAYSEPLNQSLHFSRTPRWGRSPLLQYHSFTHLANTAWGPLCAMPCAEEDQPKDLVLVFLKLRQSRHSNSQQMWRLRTVVGAWGGSS